MRMSAFPSTRRSPLSALGAPHDRVALDPEVTRPPALWPLPGVDRQGLPDPAMPVTPVPFFEGSLVDVPADHQIGLEASHEPGEEAVAVRPGADRRSLWRLVMQHEPRRSGPVALRGARFEGGGDAPRGVDAVQDRVVADRRDEPFPGRANLTRETGPHHPFEPGTWAKPSGTRGIMVPPRHGQGASGRSETPEPVENGLMLRFQGGPFGEHLAQVPAQADQVEPWCMPDHPREPSPVRVQVRDGQDARKHAI